MIKNNECHLKQLNDILITFSVAFCTLIIWLTTMLVTKILRKHFKKNNTSNWLLANLLAIDSVAFYLMTKVVESNMYPFLNILNIFP